MKLALTTLFVNDIELSKKFYEEYIGLSPVMVSDEHVAFEGGLSIWHDTYALQTTLGSTNNNKSGHGFELCFESEHIEDDFEKIRESGVGIICAPEQQPWGQIVFRLFDPDGNIVEIAEPLAHTVYRYLDGGSDIEAIAQKLCVSIDVVKSLIEE